MNAGLAGDIGLWATLALCLTAVITGRRWALLWAAVVSAATTALLARALLAGDFSLEYVAATTSLATPWPYRLAALWGGMDGSMLFFTMLTLVVSGWSLRQSRPLRVAGAVGAGLAVVTVLFANPFFVPAIPAVNGRGLLAILQHPAMVYHPPILYSGLVVLVVPFARTLGGVFAGDRSAWLSGVRRWLYASWTLLTVGMVLGSNWAYVELGWGGFWAWDPVENTALMPWLAITIFIHTSLLESSRGVLKRWNVLFAGIPFALSVMGIYLTRSGATGSIHSFAEDPVVGRALLIAAVVVAGLLAVVARRSSPGVEWRALSRRDTWLTVNVVLISAVLVFVTAGSAYPAFASVFGSRSLVVDSRFFVITVLPIAVLVGAFLAPALRTGWRMQVLVTTVLAVIGLSLVGDRVGLLLLAAAGSSLVMFATDVFRHRRPLTARTAHLGMAIFLVGVAGTSFGSEFSGSMMPGSTVTVGSHEIALHDVSTGEAPRFAYVQARFTVDGAEVRPEIRAYEDQDVPVAEPALRSTIGEDVIVAVSLLFPDGETVAVSVFTRPLVWLVWVGSGVMALAGLIALFSTAGVGAGRRRTAREEPRQGGTTTGSASRSHLRPVPPGRRQIGR